MSDENTGDRRRYRKRRRAEQEAETRLRITEAAVDLHGSVGPARTTVSAVAERAGVQRATVYRHFPDEAALFSACSSHWLAQHPLPDPSGWAGIEDPGERVRAALGDVYGWYADGEQMLVRTTRDAPLVAALRPSMGAFAGWLESVTDALLDGRSVPPGREPVVRAALAHALAFATWRSLVREQGLAPPEAVDLMAGLVHLAGGG
jgi:AcrR family transcriptional regulator